MQGDPHQLMCKFRHLHCRFKRTQKDSEIEEKSPPPADAADGGQGNNQGVVADVNFLYGRPSCNDQQRTLAYYYEDDEDFDPKMMYINDAYEQGKLPLVFKRLILGLHF